MKKSKEIELLSRYKACCEECPDNGVFCKQCMCQLIIESVEMKTRVADKKSIADMYIKENAEEGQILWTVAHIEELCKDFILIPR